MDRQMHKCTRPIPILPTGRTARGITMQYQLAQISDIKVGKNPFKLARIKSIQHE